MTNSLVFKEHRGQRDSLLVCPGGVRPFGKDSVAPTSYARIATVGVVASEPISDPLLIAALETGNLRCLTIHPDAGRTTTLRKIAECDVLLISSFLFAASRIKASFSPVFNPNNADEPIHSCSGKELLRNFFKS